MEATSKLKRPAIGLTAALLIASYAVIIFAVPFLIGKHIPAELSISAVLLLPIYVLLSLEIMHRTSIALLGAIVIVSCLIILGSFPPTTSFEFILDAIDFNTIGLLLGMMIIVAILAESGVFQWLVLKPPR